MSADLAGVFHWPPAELLELEVGELLAWHGEAKRWAGA
ncbi:MAG: GpE family phage tail protein [Lamprocystis purpurea]|nr:GpE family phage tail protein [Lamprocystis purpurea]